MGEYRETFTIRAREARAAGPNEGQAIRIINTHGEQVVDTWCFGGEDLSRIHAAIPANPPVLRAPEALSPPGHGEQGHDRGRLAGGAQARRGRLHGGTVATCAPICHPNSGIRRTIHH